MPDGGALPLLMEVARDVKANAEDLQEMKALLQAVLQGFAGITTALEGHTELLGEVLLLATAKKPKSELPKAMETLAAAVEKNTETVGNLLEVFEVMPATLERVVTLAVEQGVTNIVNQGEVFED